MATINLSAFPEPITETCPECKHQFTLYDPKGSSFGVCPTCYQYLHMETADMPIKKEKLEKIKLPPVLPLGSVGILKEQDFRVIAYLEKKEQNTDYTWQEYILYNYKKGYATLAEYNGHWNFILDKHWEPVLEKTKTEGRFATYDDFSYRLFNNYTAIVTALIGEFDWDAFNDRPKTKEYIAPPFMIIEEKDLKDEKTPQYYIGEYLKPEEIAEGFNIDSVLLPLEIGIGANQPSRYSYNFAEIVKKAILAFLVLLFFNFLIQLMKSEKVLLNSDFNIANDLSPFDPVLINSETALPLKPFVTSSFEQSHHAAPLEIELGSEVDNSWLEATVTLVNEQTNESWEVTKAIEYYHGREDGENWSEGSKSESIILSEIPKGTYHLNIYPTAGDNTQTYMHIRVISNFTIWRNIFLASLLLSIYPLWCWWMIHDFEKRRWKNSDYSPYTN